MRDSNQKTSYTVLVVDDEPSILITIKRALEQDGLVVTTAETGTGAISLLDDEIFDAIICDYGLPDMDGIEVIIEAKEKNPEIGSALITGFGADSMIVEAFTKGRVDCYLAKPFSAKEVIQAAHLAIKECSIRRREREFKLELTHRIEEATKELTIANNRLKLKESETANLNLELSKDKKRLARLNERLQRLSITDGMTGLYNHRHFSERLRAEMDRVKRYGGALSILILDIDNFKQVNDKYGHLTGDKALKSLGQVLINSSRRIDIPARYGGEEFIVILPSVALEGAATNAERLRKAIASLVIETDKGPLSLTVSTGVAAFTGSKTYNPQRLIREADEALYHAKSIGKNCVVIFQKNRLNALGKESVITEPERNEIIEKTIDFARSGKEFFPILKCLAEELMSTLDNGNESVYVGVWEKESGSKASERIAAGGPWTGKVKPDKIAEQIFKSGKPQLSEKESRQYSGFPVKTFRKGADSTSDTLAALVINRAPANPFFITNIIKSVAASLDTALVVERIRNEKKLAESMLEIALTSHEIASAIINDTQAGAGVIDGALARAALRLAKTDFVEAAVAFLVTDNKLVSVDGRRAITKHSLDKVEPNSLIAKAVMKTRAKNKVVVVEGDGALSPFDRRLFKRFGLTAPVALIPVVSKKKIVGMIIMSLASTGPQLTKTFNTFSKNMADAFSVTAKLSALSSQKNGK